MKILTFQGGLGNQLFCYAFYLYMKNKYPKEKIYGLYSNKKLSEHHGLEIDKWFDVDLPPQRWYSTALCAILYLWKQMVGNTRFVETKQEYCENESAVAFLAFKYTKKYFPSREWIKFKIGREDLSKNNQYIFDLIKSSNSVFIHVRRGDFFSKKYIHLFADTCPKDYYFKSMEHIIKEVKEPHFFVFSDDIKWAKENFPQMENMLFIDWNKGINSPIDMFLMSQCKYAIIANSSFSYWAAYLGEKKKMVFYPSKWNNGMPAPEIFYNEWITY